MTTDTGEESAEVPWPLVVLWALNWYLLSTIRQIGP
jgi:hypothetical protein